MHGTDAQDAHGYSRTDEQAVKCYLAADEACINWADEALGKKVTKGQSLPITHSLQGHPTSGRNWMHLIDKILIDEMGFKTTTHNRCIQVRGEGDNLALLLRQVDDMLMGTDGIEMAKEMSDKTGKHTKFDHEEDLPMPFLGLAHDYNGVDIEQYSDCIHKSSKSHIERLLKTHGWEKESPKLELETDAPKRPIAPISPDCLHSICKAKGPVEGTIEHQILEKDEGFSCRTSLGELMFSCVTSRPDIGCAISTLSEFASAPSKEHCKHLKGAAKYL